MLDVLRRFLIDVINSTYILIIDTIKYLSFLDSPGTYILIMVIGFVLVPFGTRSIYHRYTNPHIFEHKAMIRQTIINLLVISAIILFGYLNFLRFLSPA
ncbi:MAG: hypothetical protein JSV63_02140 [Candidatus Aenigmatarchaeota archaeon]|nr:MAG: hypothetical protein JSV63_02140 [Candidatus Aenigmarchaeota archaeon]